MRVPLTRLLLFATAATAAAVGPPPALAAQDHPQDGPDWRFTHPSFVAVSVVDLEHSSEWYARVLRLEQVHEFEAPDGSVRGRLLRSGDVVVELLAPAEPLGRDPSFPEAPAFRYSGLFKSGFFVDDVEAFHRALVGSGVDADARTFLDETLGWRMFIFRDPDGNRLQAFSRP